MRKAIVRPIQPCRRTADLDGVHERLGANNLIWVPAEIISAIGVSEYELPLFRPAGGPRSSLMHVDNSSAVQAGLTLTDPAMTVRAVRTWLANHDLPPAMSSELEAQLIRQSRNC